MRIQGSPTIRASGAKGLMFPHSLPIRQEGIDSEATDLHGEDFAHAHFRQN